MGESGPPRAEPPGPSLLVAARWPLVLVAAMGLSALVAVRACRAIEEAPRSAVRDVGEAAGAVAERFRTGRITTTFLAALPQLQPGGAVLELASYEAVETLTRSDERAVFFDLIPLGTTVSEIRVPVTYRYHVRLSDPWQLEVKGPVCVVKAPPLRPTLPPALHTDRMEKRSQEGWLRFDAHAQMAALERSLTPTLSQRAGSAANLGLVRDTGRQRVAAFVRDWLLREDQWRNGSFGAITVTFADEPAGPAALPSPTLRRGEP